MAHCGLSGFTAEGGCVIRAVAGRQVFAVVKASTPARVAENRAAMDISFSAEELEQLDRAFPPPTRTMPLEML